MRSYALHHPLRGRWIDRRRRYTGLTVAEMRAFRAQDEGRPAARSRSRRTAWPSLLSRTPRRRHLGPVQRADRHRLFQGSHDRAEGRRGFRQGQREVRHPRRRHGENQARRQRREGAGHDAVARRTARNAAGMLKQPATRIASVVQAPAGRSPAFSAPMPGRTKRRKAGFRTVRTLVRTIKGK